MSNTIVSQTVQAQFLALLPQIETHARIHFRDVICFQSRADCVSESIALAWKWFLRLTERGKDISGFPTVFAFYVARAVRCGRRVCGQEKTNDFLSSIAQHKHGFRAERLGAVNSSRDEPFAIHPNGVRPDTAFDERLFDNTVTPPDEQAMFRIDFADWLQTFTEREKSIIAVMSHDEPTKKIAYLFGVTPGRIAQMRRTFHDHWIQFCGDKPSSARDLDSRQFMPYACKAKDVSFVNEPLHYDGASCSLFRKGDLNVSTSYRSFGDPSGSGFKASLETEAPKASSIRVQRNCPLVVEIDARLRRTREVSSKIAQANGVVYPFVPSTQCAEMVAFEQEATPINLH